MKIFPIILEFFCFDLLKASGYPTCEDTGVGLISTKVRLLNDAFVWANNPVIKIDCYFHIFHPKRIKSTSYLEY